MGVLDIIIGAVLVYGLYKGVKNGLFVEVASLIALVAGLYGAIHFSYIVGDYLSDHMEWNARYINLSAFIITFILIVLVVHLAGKFLTKIADFAMLGLINKIAGGAFGVLKHAVILSALLAFFHQANTSLKIVKEETLEDSILYAPVKELGAFVFSLVLKKETSDGEITD
ncbi:CvpA family protein [Spongiimicrobium salis]|uniref:CvpA family protein n=1 Tax=Spongiimicrobium salis TaxID=1667022 RepID=UPI00374C973E